MRLAITIPKMCNDFGSNSEIIIINLLIPSQEDN